MIDCHVHSSFSGDSGLPVETACDKAIDLGLEGIAFTDHLDIDFPNFDPSFMIDFDEYSKHMDRTKSLYKGKLKVLKGIEVGLQPHVIEESDRIVRSCDFDTVIASVHIIDGMDPYIGDYFNGKTKKQADTRYLEEILSGMKAFKNYDILGHIGYIRRYSVYDDKTLRHDDYCDLIDTILKTVIEDGKCIEVNTSGLRSALGTPIPDFDVVKRYRELGGELITLGSDAHAVEQIGTGFDYVKEMLSSLGFKNLTHFENRKPLFTRI